MGVVVAEVVVVGEVDGEDVPDVDCVDVTDVVIEVDVVGDVLAVVDGDVVGVKMLWQFPEVQIQVSPS